MVDQSWREMAACSPCQSAWVKCQTHQHRGSSLRIAREMLTFSCIWSDEPIGAEEEQETYAGTFVITKSRREDLPLGEIWVGKFTDWVSPMKSKKSFAAVPWLVRVETPSQFAWWQFKSPHMRKSELGWVAKSLSMLSERDVDGVVTVSTRCGSGGEVAARGTSGCGEVWDQYKSSEKLSCWCKL